MARGGCSRWRASQRLRRAVRLRPARIAGAGDEEVDRGLGRGQEFHRVADHHGQSDRHRLLESFEFASTDDDCLRAFALLDDEPTMGSTLAADVLKAIDHGSPVITDWIAAKLSSTNRADWRVGRSLLDNPMFWSAYRDRARAIAGRSLSADTVAGIVYARTPSGWVGSRRPGIEVTLGATLAEIGREESADDADDDDPEPLA